MRRVGGIIGALFAVGLQVGLWPQVTLRFLPAFCLALAFAWGFSAGRLSGFRLAFVLGLLLDLYAQHNFGMFTLAMLTGYGVTFAASRTDDPAAGRLVAVVAGATAYELVVLLFLRLSDGRFPFFAELIGVATLNIASTVVVFLICAAVAGAFTDHTRPHAQRPVRI